MDQDYFGDSGETAVQQDYNPPTYDNFAESQDQDQEPEFEFANSNNFTPAEDYGSYSQSIEEETQTARQIREQEERIQERLREKSNKEYELKSKRRVEGRMQLEVFMEKKEQEKVERQAENLEKQKKMIERNKADSHYSSWVKVGNNISLKQGEHPGKKDVNRMRQSILNKRNDEAK